MNLEAKSTIEAGKAILGIEFGSTRIKAVLIDQDNKPIAQGSHEWENRLENGIWTYSLDDIWTGLQDCYGDMLKDVKEKYDAEITTIGAIGFSAMMHGYMAFDENKNLLVPFRTWRNAMTGKANKLRSEITIQNTGKTTLEISSLQMFTAGMQISLGKSKLAPTETTKLKIQIDSEELKKQKSRPRILMITNDPKKPKVMIEIR